MEAVVIALLAIIFQLVVIQFYCMWKMWNKIISIEKKLVKDKVEIEHLKEDIK